jgi:transcriptional regulator with XRE-family HTH domain
MEIFGERLRQVRQIRGVSQTDLARQLGIPRQQINNYEHGRFVPSLEMACRIADALDVSLDILTGRRDLPPADLRMKPALTASAVNPHGQGEHQCWMGQHRPAQYSMTRREGPLMTVPERLALYEQAVQQLVALAATLEEAEEFQSAEAVGTLALRLARDYLPEENVTRLAVELHG